MTLRIDMNVRIQYPEAFQRELLAIVAQDNISQGAAKAWFRTGSPHAGAWLKSMAEDKVPGASELLGEFATLYSAAIEKSIKKSKEIRR